jgi:pimeloyl-ACP methyl ester carboxylesterase
VQELALALLRGVAERGARVGWAATPAGPLRFAVRGPKGAQPLLVVHGLGDSLAGWAQVAGALSRRHELHLLDLPGHGLSRDPPDWRFSTLAAAVGHYARALREPVLVGHSLGGWIALRLALAGAPIAGLLLVNPAGALLDEGQWAPFRELLSATDRAGVRRYLERAWHRPPLALRLLPQEVIDAMWTRATRGVLDAVQAADFLREDELRSLRLPVRLLWGESDRLLPEGTLPLLRRGLASAELVTLPRCGHVPHLECPRALARALLRPLPGVR